MPDMTGQVAMVTGAARGQGRTTALEFAAAGADVVALDICGPVETTPYELSSSDDLAAVAKEIEALGRRVVALECDVRDQAGLDSAVAQTVDEFGRLDVLAGNAGIFGLRNLWELSDREWQDMIDVNLTGAWRSLKAVVPTMIDQGHGSIVLTSSGNGFEPLPLAGHYVSAKHGVIGLMRNAAVELGKHHIRCNAVCPGIVDTDMNKWQGILDMMAGKEGGTNQDRIDGAHFWSTLAGVGLIPPEAVSRAVVFLASEEASHITGTALPVDAGHLAMPGYNTEPVGAQ
jgi:SDR family mycofactocin-dependent oxidoreductase